MPPPRQSRLNKFLNSTTWKIAVMVVPVLISLVTLYVVYSKIPDQVKTTVKNINETHDNVKIIMCSLQDKIESGQDVTTGISKRATDGQAILLKNSGLNFEEGQSIVLYNPGSNYKPRIKLLIAAVEEPTTPIERSGKIQMYINKNAVAMLNYSTKEGSKKLKIFEFKNGNK